jgi:hypothetical protein
MAKPLAATRPLRTRLRNTEPLTPPSTIRQTVAHRLVR